MLMLPLYICILYSLIKHNTIIYLFYYTLHGIRADDSLGSKLKLPHYKFRALMAFIVGVGDVEEDGDGNDDEDVVI